MSLKVKFRPSPRTSAARQTERSRYLLAATFDLYEPRPHQRPKLALFTNIVATFPIFTPRRRDARRARGLAERNARHIP